MVILRKAFSNGNHDSLTDIGRYLEATRSKKGIPCGQMGGSHAPRELL